MLLCNVISDRLIIAKVPDFYELFLEALCHLCIFLQILRSSLNLLHFHLFLTQIIEHIGRPLTKGFANVDETLRVMLFQ